MSLVLSAVMTMLVVAGYAPEKQVNAESPAIWDGTADVAWYDDELTEFHLSTAEQLAGLAALVNSGKKMTGQTIILDSDIILNDISNYDNWSSEAPVNKWTTIGIGEFSKYFFNGTFDGGGHTITGLYQHNSDAYVGLFAHLDSDGIISNILCEYNYVYVRSSIYGSIAYAGGICGENSGTISNCINKGYVHAGSTTGYAGGICGENSGTISNCINKGYVYVGSSSGSVGGICGCASGDWSIENCYNQGSVNGRYSGGILGCSRSKGKISNVYNTGTISGSSYAGGILGIYDKLPVMTACYYLGSGTINGIGSYSGDPYTISKNSTIMQSEEFVKSLGDAFIYNPGGYPMLALEMNVNTARFDKEDVTLSKSGEKVTLNLITSYLGKPVWVSGDTNVATVENGVVTAVSDGTATIYAICGDVTATCTVTVALSPEPTEPTKPAEASLNYDTVTMDVGETFTLEVLNFDGTCTWLSSDTKIAKVSSDGVITAAANGETVIYAILSNGKTLSCNVSVNAKPVTIADVVLLQKFLIKQLTIVPATADINSDGKINVFDLILMKRLLINKK